MDGIQRNAAGLVADDIKFIIELVVSVVLTDQRSVGKRTRGFGAIVLDVVETGGFGAAPPVWKLVATDFLVVPERVCERESIERGGGPQKTIFY